MNKKNKEFEYKNILFLIPYFKKTKSKFFIGLIGMALSSLLIAPIPYLVGYSIDNIILMNKSYLELLKITSVMITIYILGYIITVIYSYIFSRVQQNVVNQVRVSMVESIIDAPLSFHNKNDKGYILGRISESGNLAVLFSPTFLGILTGIFDFVFSLFIMVKLSIPLTVLALIIIPIYFFISKYASQKITDSTTKVYESSAVLNGEIFETLNGIEEIKLLNGKEIQINKLKSKLSIMAKNLLKQNLNFILFVQNIILSNNLVTTLVLFSSGILILNDHMTIGIYTSFSLYMSRLLSTTQAFGSLEITLKPVCISIKRIKELLKTENESNNGISKLNTKIESIKFENVCFKYEANNEYIFENLNIELKIGDKVLISGINGSGKTTLIKLITGLYKPLSGKILVNGYDYTLMDLYSIRDRIGIVSQNIFLFKGTVLDNILFGQRNKTMQDVIIIAEQYNLSEYINRFDKGLETEVSQNGFGLSGGQAQVIAFLRAIIAQRDIIILDEATSNLDMSARDIIINIIKNNQICNILITISHQEEGYQFTNKIINLNQIDRVTEAQSV